MAFGDVGGTITELILTCRTPSSGTVHIEKGDAVSLVGPYVVTNTAAVESPVLGQAMAAASGNNVALPVKVRGICVFAYTGSAPTIDGKTGITASSDTGKVKAPQSGDGSGIVLKTDTVQSVVHVLL
ncbi:MAG TPA: hypothetical protein PKY35_05025 [Candidatus Hydrogenedentes bacterium]|nr:hypothetical protein [Candidatus Hydrogenedentota bacterium]HOL76373.1 hypothetical protein [Candidatus Hydrogenedentota bacterium]HPO85411.1 hypothetical protein [Candidatus Hydrogenedentota bacterium]